MKWQRLLILSLTLTFCGCTGSLSPPAAQPPDSISTPPAPVLSTADNSPDPTAAPPTLTNTPNPNQGEIAIAPPDLSLFNQYLEVVREPTHNAVDLVIEGTVLAIQQSEICPYQEEICPIAPYPNDWGTMRVDAVLTDQGLGDDGQVEQPDAADSAEGVQSSAENQGVDVQEKGPSSLSAGQEIQVQFLLSARPAVARLVPGVPSADNREGAANSETAAAPPGEYQPILVEEGRFVFTMGISSAEQIEDTILPGLQAGDRIRAAVTYDGTARMLVYETLP